MAEYHLEHRVVDVVVTILEVLPLEPNVQDPEVLDLFAIYERLLLGQREPLVGPAERLSLEPFLNLLVQLLVFFHGELREPPDDLLLLGLKSLVGDLDLRKFLLDMVEPLDDVQLILDFLLEVHDQRLEQELLV